MIPVMRWLVIMTSPPSEKHFVDFYGTTPSTFKSKEDTEDKKIIVNSQIFLE